MVTRRRSSGVRGGLINSFCHLDKLWNEGEEHSVEETGEGYSHTEGKRKKDLTG